MFIDSESEMYNDFVEFLISLLWCLFHPREKLKREKSSRERKE